MSRKTTDDERRLFRKHVAETVVKAALPKSKPPAKAARKAGTLDGNTAEKLRRGQLEPGARIDLHGLTEARAHRALLTFLGQARQSGVRLALVVTGIGNPGRGETAEWMRPSHGVLKEMVPRWLNEREFAALISGWTIAHKRHGGEGALYVYLRKSSRPQDAKP